MKNFSIRSLDSSSLPALELKLKANAFFGRSSNDKLSTLNSHDSVTEYVVLDLVFDTKNSTKLVVHGSCVIN